MEKRLYYPEHCVSNRKMALTLVQLTVVWKRSTLPWQEFLKPALFRLTYVKKFCMMNIGEMDCKKRGILKARSTIETDKKRKTKNEDRRNIKIIENFLTLKSQYLIKAPLCSKNKVGVTKILRRILT